jgi:hypothetical protein
MTEDWERNMDPLGCLVRGVSRRREVPEVLTFLYWTLRPLASALRPKSHELIASIN